MTAKETVSKNCEQCASKCGNCQCVPAANHGDIKEALLTIYSSEAGEFIQLLIPGDQLEIKGGLPHA